MHEKDLVRFIRRKGVPTQNIMAACSFDMQFIFVMAGWEGATHDGRLFQYAIQRKELNFPKPLPGINIFIELLFFNKNYFFDFKII